MLFDGSVILLIGVTLKRAGRHRHSERDRHYAVIDGGAEIERRVPIIPFSKEEQIPAYLKRCLVLYRLAFGQPRQEDLLNHLLEKLPPEAAEKARQNWQISLLPCK